MTEKVRQGSLGISQRLWENLAKLHLCDDRRASRQATALSPNDDVKMSTTQKTQKPKAGRSAIADVVAREYTIHLHKRVRSV